MSTNPFNERFYTNPPETMTLEMCREHARNHKGYNWSIKLDPRWSDEQKQAYLDAYDKSEVDESW